MSKIIKYTVLTPSQAVGSQRVNGKRSMGIETRMLRLRVGNGVYSAILDQVERQLASLIHPAGTLDTAHGPSIEKIPTHNWLSKLGLATFFPIAPKPTLHTEPTHHHLQA